MDLSTLKIDSEAADLVLNNPKTGEKTDMVLHCVGTDSEQFKAIDRALAKKRMLDAQKKGGMKRVIQQADFADIEEDDCQRLAACITGWKNIFENDAELEYSQKNCIHILKEYPWIKDQVTEFVSERANFIKAA